MLFLFCFSLSYEDGTGVDNKGGKEGIRLNVCCSLPMHGVPMYSPCAPFFFLFVQPYNGNKSPVLLEGSEAVKRWSNKDFLTNL